METGHTIYPQLGGDLAYACERLGKGLGALGVIIILYRGEGRQTEIALSFAPSFETDSAEFERLTTHILADVYSTNISKSDKACEMLCKATAAECVIVFIINHDGPVRVGVSEPRSKEFVAAFALQISKELGSRSQIGS